ncbi:MAG TPA: ATP-binding protein [Corynebacteriales bacterium]|nr:ATP-binding protein [Mycobacteriales bacterium]
MDERPISELANLGFVSQCSNVILLGPPCVDKTHLATALRLENRLERRMQVYTFTRLFNMYETGYLPLD